jgi:RNA-directed DNA polymerase
MPIDDVSLAFSIGIKSRSLWWLIMKNQLEDIQAGRGSYRRFEIPKKNGTKRVIHEPRPAMKNAQKALLVTYFNPLPVEDCVGAYVPGRSIQESARQHVGRAVKLSMDIQNFFGSTRRVWVRDWLRTLGFGEEVVRPLSSLLTVPTVTSTGRVVSVLPQGAPTSGAVANHVASAKIDAPVKAFLDKQIPDSSWYYTRYSDNLEISFDEDLSRADMDSIRDGLWDVISQGGYRLAPHKVYVQRSNSPARPYRVLGFAANEKLNIPKEKHARLRAIVHNLSTSGYASQRARHKSETTEEMYRSVYSELIYWRQVAPWKIQPLIDQLSQVPRN